jgi:hypothetical protein
VHVNGQLSAELLPVNTAFGIAVQGVHVVAPVLEYWPMPHVIQLVALLSEYVVALHCVQDSDSVVDEYDPAGHWTHRFDDL